MSRKDLLAAGQRTATFVGGVGDGVDLKKVSDEPRFEFTPEPSAKEARRIFTPAGKTVLIRRNELSVSPILQGVDSVEKEQSNDGEILAVGPLVNNFTVGQTAVFGKYAGTLYPLNGEELIMAQEDEILGTLGYENSALDNNVNVGVCCSRFGINGNGGNIPSPGFDSDGNRLEGRA